MSDNCSVAKYSEQGKQINGYSFKQRGENANWYIYLQAVKMDSAQASSAKIIF